MRRTILHLFALASLLLAGSPGSLLAASSCEEEAKQVGTDSTRHFMILAARNGVFYERSGPAFVVLIRAGADDYDIGALGIYAGDSKQPVFGPVPASAYGEFMRETGKASSKKSDVMLRLEINAAQYQRALQVLRSWERRVQEKALLYPEIALDNILLVKQATEELNRCTRTIAAYDLDWGLEDDISENNGPLRIPYEYFKELKRLNGARHVPDAAMPAALLAATDERPLPAFSDTKE
jgi:hypothetical protein